MSNIKVTNNIRGVDRKFRDYAKQAFNRVSTDVKRVSSDAAPHKTGFLEKNHLDIDYGKSDWKAEVYFIATAADGFDYAEWTHTADYNLGPKSRQKPGGNSKFTGHVKVGKGYLSNTVEQGHDNYVAHIQEKLNKSIS